MVETGFAGRITFESDRVNFTKENDDFVYGHVKGYSMWPCFIPGDILRAGEVRVGQLSAGDIVVLDSDSSTPVVHRLKKMNMNENGTVTLVTEGDRSGQDPPRTLDPKEELLRVVGVLRRGKWKKPKRYFITILRKVPGRFVTVHCRIIRRICW